MKEFKIVEYQCIGRKVKLFRKLYFIWIPIKTVFCSHTSDKVEKIIEEWAVKYKVSTIQSLNNLKK